MSIEADIKKHQRLFIIGILIGLALTWGPEVAMEPEQMPSLRLGLAIAGIFAFIWGCRHYAMSKGRHPAWGWLGLLNIFGLVFLVLMGNRSRRRS